MKTTLKMREYPNGSVTLSDGPLRKRYELNEQALQIAKGMAIWFHRWTCGFSRQEMDDLLDLETGGMLEIWADLYGITGEPEHRELIYRYDRRRFFDALLEGADVLTNKHANTQIPEILGAARAWEVTGDERFRRVVEAFWTCAVKDRGYVCTGAGDDGELWMPPGEFASRMGVGQEHCCCYNMMRLAQVLLRWSGDPVYADYWERRFVNGVLAHQHGESGMVSYFLGVGAGSRKAWGSPTGHFWCCHGTLMQANAAYEQAVYMELDEGIAVNQWIASELHTHAGGTSVGIRLMQKGQHAVHPLNGWSVEGMEAITKVHIPALPNHRPDRYIYTLAVTCEQAAAFTLKLRIPWWVQGSPSIWVNGERLEAADKSVSSCTIKREWKTGDNIRVELPKALTAEPLPGEPGTVAFLDGPVVLAGLVDEERRLAGNPDEPASLLVPDRERNHSWWNAGYYRTRGQSMGFRFIPLYEVKDEAYTIYFPVIPKEGI